MDKFYTILNDCLEVEHQLASLLYILNILREEYEATKKEELLLLVSLFKTNLSSVKNSTSEIIDTLDETLSLLAHSSPGS